ncbi:right-handed parallel beta-helix repeat-containing protein [Mangrovibacterium sp.]|uniref:T9SS type A sorting domain-containing protein n=1 Tax=Mangrovibacterium sp. TaxID=1961364 RepID=UPI00356AC4EB
MKRINYFFFLLLFLPVVAQSQNTIHVYSLEIPWEQSAISKETEKIYSITEAISQASEGDSIVIHKGIYREKITVTKNNLKLVNYQNDYVLVSGANIVTNWTKSTGMTEGVMEADISGLSIETPFTQLFANGETQMMARHPNNVSGNMMEPMDMDNGYALLSNVKKDAGSSGTGYITLEETTMPDVDLTGGIARALTGKMAEYVFGTITANSGNSVSFTPLNNGDWKSDDAITTTKHKFSWGFVMHKNLIDYPGEWFADNGTLYYLPKSGENMDSTRIEVQVRERVLVLSNSSGVTIKGINFIAGNVDMQNTSSATIEGCSMRYLYPFWIPTGYGQGESDKKGIYLYNSSNNTFKDCHIAHSWGNMVALSGGQQNAFENCRIEDFGWIGIFTSGIHISKSDDTQINKCTFGDAGRFQIRIDGGDAKVTIMDCDFYGAMKIGEDAGPIEATSTGKIGSIDLKGSVIAYNKVHDVVGVPVSSGNYMRVKATAFYMEDVENYTAHHNLVYNIKHNAYDGPYDIEKVGEFLYLGPRYNAMHEPVNYYNNTIWNIDENIGIWNIVISNWAELGIVPPDTTGLIENGHFANNIFMNGPGYRMSYNSQVITSTGGLVSWATSPAGASIETDDFETYTSHCAQWGYQFNPQTNASFNFSDADINFLDAANGDFTLKTGSAAIGAGTVLDGITSSATPDCGALEGGNRVLYAGATLSIPQYKEEGTNFIPDTEWIKYVDFPAEFSDTTTVFMLKIAYNVFSERDIVVSFRTPADVYLSQGRLTVPAGQDTVLVTVKTSQTQAVADDYIFLAAIRPKGGSWSENIYTQTLTSNIVSTVVTSTNIVQAAEYKVYPNPTSGIVYIQTEGENLGLCPVSIYSVNGGLVLLKKIQFDNNQSSIDLSSLPSGTYIVSVGRLGNSILLKTE